jgi:CRP-like cAMP-binding protein
MGDIPLFQSSSAISFIQQLKPMEELYLALESFTHIPNEIKLSLLSVTKKDKFRVRRYQPTDEYFLSSLIYIESGLIKLCFETEHDQERILRIIKPGEFIYLPKPQSYFLFLEDTILRRISQADLIHLCDKFQVFYQYLMQIIGQEYEREKLFHYILLLPPDQRMRSLKNSFPTLFTDVRIKDYMIASMVGLDKGTVSRYKKEGVI